MYIFLGEKRGDMVFVLPLFHNSALIVIFVCTTSSTVLTYHFESLQAFCTWSAVIHALQRRYNAVGGVQGS